MKWTLRIALLVTAALCIGPVAAQVIDLDKPKEEAPAKPDVWAKAPEADAKAAEESARKDACVRLVEAAYRLPVAGNRDVLDMLLRNLQVDKDLAAGLAGAKPVNAEYREDGSVRVTVTTTPAEVMEILKNAYAKVDWDLQEEDATIAAVATLTKKDAVISAVGESALAGSDGEKRIPVRRAAMQKAKVEIAGTFLGMILGSVYGKDERVRDFCLLFPDAKRKLALELARTRVYSEEWKEGGCVDLRAEAVAKPFAERLVKAQNLYDREGKCAQWGWWGLQKGCEDLLVQGKAQAKPGDAVPANTPLAGEFRAVEEAMKAK